MFHDISEILDKNQKLEFTIDDLYDKDYNKKLKQPKNTKNANIVMKGKRQLKDANKIKKNTNIKQTKIREKEYKKHTCKQHHYIIKPRNFQQKQISEEGSLTLKKGVNRQQSLFCQNKEKKLNQQDIFQKKTKSISNKNQLISRQKSRAKSSIFKNQNFINRKTSISDKATETANNSRIRTSNNSMDRIRSNTLTNSFKKFKAQNQQIIMHDYFGDEDLKKPDGRKNQNDFKKLKTEGKSNLKHRSISSKNNFLKSSISNIAHSISKNIPKSPKLNKLRFIS